MGLSLATQLHGQQSNQVCQLLGDFAKPTKTV